MEYKHKTIAFSPLSAEEFQTSASVFCSLVAKRRGQGPFVRAVWPELWDGLLQSKPGGILLIERFVHEINQIMELRDEMRWWCGGTVVILWIQFPIAPSPGSHSTYALKCGLSIYKHKLRWSWPKPNRQQVSATDEAAGSERIQRNGVWDCCPRFVPGLNERRIGVKCCVCVVNKSREWRIERPQPSAKSHRSQPIWNQTNTPFPVLFFCPLLSLPHCAAQ